MGLLTKLFAATPENPKFSLQDPDAWDALFSGLESTSGIRINREKALTYSPWWRGINLLSADVGKLPLHVFRRVGAGKEKAIDHASYFLLRRKPNEFQTAFQFRRQLTAHALSTGNGYGYVFRNGDGTAREILPLSPDVTFPVREDGRLLYLTEVDEQQRKLFPEDVVHVRGLGFDGLTGYSAIEKAKESLGLGLGARKHATVYFKNAARPAVVIETPNRVDEKTITNLRTSWEQLYTGLDNAHRTAVLQQGMQAKPLSFSAKDSQFLETRQFELREVANWIGVPSHKVGDTTRTSFASLEQENRSYLSESLDVWLVTWEEECWDKLLSEEEKREDTHFVEFLRQASIQTDTKTEAEVFRIALGGQPYMTVNEVRSKLNMNPVDGGDDLQQPLNMANPGGNPDFSEGAVGNEDEEDDSELQEDS